MEKLSPSSVDHTNDEQLHEKNLTSGNEELAPREIIDTVEQDDRSWADIIKADIEPEFIDPSAQAEFDLAHLQRDEILQTAEEIRTSERRLTNAEAKELGLRAITLARNQYLGAAEAEAMMVNLAASTQKHDHSVLAHRTINERFNLSSPEHRRSSHEIASRVIAMTNKELGPATANGRAIEEAFFDRYGHTSDESIINQIETAKIKRDEDEAIEVHRRMHARLIDSYGAAISTIRSATSEKEISTAGNKISNIAFEKAESLTHTPEDILIIEAAVKILEEQSDKVSSFKSDAEELHELVQAIIEKAPASQQEDYKKAYDEVMSGDFNIDNALKELSQTDANEKIAA